jgi:hypothetical protein
MKVSSLTTDGTVRAGNGIYVGDSETKVIDENGVITGEIVSTAGITVGDTEVIDENGNIIGSIVTDDSIIVADTEVIDENGNIVGSIVTTDAITVGDTEVIDADGAFVGSFKSGAPEFDVAASGALTFTGGVSDGEKLSIAGVDIELSTDGTVTEGYTEADISSGTPTQAVSKMEIVGFPADTDTITITAGETTDTYEIDALGTGVEEGNIQVDVSTHYAKATATLTFDGVVADGEYVEINGVKFEIDDDGSVEEGNIPVWVGANTSAASAIIALAAAIRLNEACDVTAADGALDTLVVTAKEYGTAANDYTVSTTCANGTWGESVTTLANGDQPTPAEIAGAIETASSGGTLAVTLAAGTEDDIGKLICTATFAGALDGSAGNAVVLGTTGTSMEWESATLEGGTDATYAEAIAVLAALEISGVTLAAGTEGDADKLLIEAAEEGADGNEIATLSDLANATFGAEHLEGGSDAQTYGEEYHNRGFFDGSHFYIAKWNADNEEIVWIKFTGSVMS